MKLQHKFAIEAMLQLLVAGGLYVYGLPMPFWGTFLAASLVYDFGAVLASLQREGLAMKCFMLEQEAHRPNPLADLISKVKVGTIDEDGNQRMLN